MRLWGAILVGVIFCSCGVEPKEQRQETVFKLLDNKEIGIDFINQLDYTEELNTYTFKNFYNGGGVGLGDFDNDGLLDIFLSGNLVPNKLYKNLGDFKFQDISVQAGIEMPEYWSTGVSIVDINSDGFLDIYVCKSGPPGGSKRHNELFINNGDLTFSEQSKLYGLDFTGLSTHAAFFDYDKDGDLDCYLLNNSLRSVGGYDYRQGQREIPDPQGGNKLLRNDGGKFTDQTSEAGIYSSAIGFGLGVTIGDINKDNYPDIYVSNDFFEKDYLYINNGNGTFSERLEAHLREISLGSMGADMADINNDGLPDIFVTEMLPEHDKRFKTTTQFENFERQQLSIKNGYYRQFGRNVLQLNNGNGSFSEIGRYTGVHATDWSWGALIFDMNNDGNKDLFVANGIYKDLLNQDYVNFAANERFTQKEISKGNVITRLIDSIPSTKISNYAFYNNGDFTFKNVTSEWGLDAPSFSNGSAYGDLDNDGDLDLVVNNVNMPVSIYKNQSEKFFPKNAYLSFRILRDSVAVSALGAKINVWSNGQYFYQELFPQRGFMSSVDHKLIVGMGDNAKADSIIITWPNDTFTKLVDVPSNQSLTIFQNEASKPEPKEFKTTTTNYFTNITSRINIKYSHKESEYNDFDKSKLLFNMISNEGPCICTADIDGNGFDDFFIGGAKGEAGALFLQTGSGTFKKIYSDLFAVDKESEDVTCEFFDANKDGSLDLYVGSGSNEHSSSTLALLDRLYVNNGRGDFSKSKLQLPVTSRLVSTSVVISRDYDHDGDIDLFVGSRLEPGLYGIPSSSYLLQNDGMGNFKDVTSTDAPEFEKIGMVTDAKWIDVNNDQLDDLIIVGEWMSIKVFVNEQGKLIDRSTLFGMDNTNGWYNTIEIADFNNDGFMDFVVGNHGLNSRFKATLSQPISLYINDFDRNGSVEQITTYFDEGKSYPLVLKGDLVSQLPGLRKKYLYFKNYAEAGIEELFSKEQLEHSIRLDAFDMETAVWMNSGKNSFTKYTLPFEAQLSPVYAIHIDDCNGDGIQDMLLGGNLYRSKPETGIYDASYGLVLEGDGDGKFNIVSYPKSGLNISGEIRSIKKLNNDLLLVGKNSDELEILKKNIKK